MRFLFVDRVLQLIPSEVVRGIKHITEDDYYLVRNKTDRPYFMPSFIGETLGQLAAWNVMVTNNFTGRPVAGVVSRAELHRHAYVGDTLLLESFIDVLDDQAVQYHSVARVGNEVVFSLEGALGPLLPMGDFIHTDVVRRQYAEIDRPGVWPPVNSPSDSMEINQKRRYLSDYIPFMQFDRILSIIPGVSLCAEKKITRAAPYFPDHFPLNPVLPMTVLLECTLNLADEFVARACLAHQFRVAELRKIKMNAFVHPGDIITCYVTVKSQSVSSDTTEPRPLGSGIPLANERGSDTSGETMTKAQNANELILTFRHEVCGRRVCILDVIMREY